MQVTPIIHPHLPQKDNRFSELVGAEKWLQLPLAIRQRFGKRIRGGDSIAYQGVVTQMRMNWAGFILAHAARIFGAPLPYDLSCVGQPAVVTVTEDVAGNGQFWVRQYGRQAGFPQVVHSSKRLAGPTGPEEYIGFGIGMALKVDAAEHALMFKSDHYFLSVFGRRIRLPKLISPGDLTIGHHDLGGGKFRLSLSLKARLFGEMLRQDAVFRDAKT